MILAISLAAAALPASQSNGAAIADAQRRLRAAIEGSVVAGQRFAAAADDPPCWTGYSYVYPGATSAEAPIRIQWAKVVAVEYVAGGAGAKPLWKGWVKARTGNGYWDFHPSPEQVGPMMAAASELMRLCGGGASPARPAAPPVIARTPVTPAPRPAPAPATAPVDLSARTHIGKEKFSGIDLCRFVRVPELVLRRASTAMHIPAIADYAAVAREDPRVRFVVSVRGSHYGRAPKPDWDDLMARPAVLSRDGAGLSNARSFFLYLDGKDTGLGFDDHVERAHFLTDEDSDRILPIASPQGFFHGWSRQIEALEKGSTLLLVARDAQGEVGRFTFDIRTLRLVPRAIVASNWACP